jgi:flagellar biosynthesis protein FlhF
MNIRRFFAPNMRQAMKMVKKEQGESAVILSNRAVDGGVEVVAAVDEEHLGTVSQKTVEKKSPPPASKPAKNLLSSIYGQSDSVEPERVPHSGSAKANYKNVQALYQKADVSSSAKVPEKKSVKNKNSQFSADLIRQKPSASGKDSSVSYDQDLAEMRREMRNMRGLLENQLSGLAWGEMSREKPVRVDLLKKLTELGIGQDVAHWVMQQVVERSQGEVKSADQTWIMAQQVIAENIPVTDDDILNDGGIVALIGSTGVGKTTTIAKLAARFAMRQGKENVALVTTDCFRIGAQEQLKTFGELMGVSVFVASGQDELGAILADLKHKKLVLIDTAGMSQRDLRLSEQFSTLEKVNADIKSYLVLSATMQLAGLDEVVRRFRKIPLSGCIVTKLDESASLGDAVSAILRHKLPVAYLGDGQKVPEDLKIARARDIVDQAISQIKSTEQTTDDALMALQFGGTIADAYNG